MISTFGTEYQITYAIAAYSDADDPAHRFQAVTDDGEIIAELYVDPDTLIIANIETRPAYRREGIATALFAAAENQLPEVLHARPAHRTPEGDGWADAVGGDTEEADEDELEAV